MPKALNFFLRWWSRLPRPGFKRCLWFSPTGAGGVPKWGWVRCGAICAFALPSGAGTSRGHLLRRGHNGLHDLHIAGAAAEIAGDGLSYLNLGVVGGLLQESLGHQDDAGGAEAALDGPVVYEGLLDGVKLAVLGQALNGEDVSVPGIHRQNHAGGHRLSVHEHGAGPAVPLVAPLFGAGKSYLVPDDIQKAPVGLHRQIIDLTVNLKVY